MPDLFPFFGDTEATNQQVAPLYKEIAWDFKRNEPIIENGDFKIVTGNEAIKSWVYRALQVKRYRYMIHTQDFGHELENLIGRQYSKNLIDSECKRYLEECLLINPYITSITDIENTFSNGVFSVQCKLNTIYGESNMEVNIDV